MPSSLYVVPHLLSCALLSPADQSTQPRAAPAASVKADLHNLATDLNEQGGYNLNGAEAFGLENGSSQGQNLAVAAVSVLKLVAGLCAPVPGRPEHAAASRPRRVQSGDRSAQLECVSLEMSDTQV